MAKVYLNLFFPLYQLNTFERRTPTHLCNKTVRWGTQQPHNRLNILLNDLCRNTSQLTLFFISSPLLSFLPLATGGGKIKLNKLLVGKNGRKN